MELVKLYICDSNNIDIEKMIESSLLRKEDIDIINTYKLDINKKEEAVSYILKRKYIGNFVVDKNGKPISDNIFFNISHSKGVVVLAINNNHPVGVDIEHISSKDDNFVSYITNGEERKFINSDIDIYKIWTNKESLLKCVGTGIRTRLNDVTSLPIEGKREYLNKSYYSHQLLKDNHVISITMEDSDFGIDVEHLDII